MKLTLSGSIVAIVTPMFADGEIDLESLKQLVDWHIESGTSAIVAVGTTGESPVLNETEHEAVVTTVVEQTAGRIAVIAGNGACSTKQAINLTKIAKVAGADACLCVTPYYNRPQQQGLIEHFTAVAESEDIAQILYNVPSRTAVDLLPETVATLAEIENVVALKEAVTDPLRHRELIQLVADKIDLLSGDDASCLEFMNSGAKGVISVTANIVPSKMAEMCRLVTLGEYQKAKRINNDLLGLHENLFLESNPIPVKWALSRMGRLEQGIRLPLTKLSEQHQKKLALTLANAEVSFN